MMSPNVIKFCFWMYIIQGVLSMSSTTNSSDESRLAVLERTLQMLEDRVSNNTRDIYRLSTSNLARKHVMFYVTLSAVTILTEYSIVKFDHIEVDEGANFNDADGIFVAPVSGIYLFSWTMRTLTNKAVDTELRVNKKVEAEDVVSLGTGRVSGTVVALARVNKNEHVWIETGKGFMSENYLDEYYGAKCSFTGLLIHET